MKPFFAPGTTEVVSGYRAALKLPEGGLSSFYGDDRFEPQAKKLRGQVLEQFGVDLDTALQEGRNAAAVGEYARATIETANPVPSDEEAVLAGEVEQVAQAGAKSSRGEAVAGVGYETPAARQAREAALVAAGAGAASEGVRARPARKPAVAR